MYKKTEIIYLHETVLQSWLRDIGSAVIAIAMIGLGVLLQSSAMQWTGGLLFFMVLMWRGVKTKDTAMTPQEAANKLAAEFGVTAQIDK